MVILITGASHTGKTLLAQKLLEKRGYPYLSLDHLKMGLIRSGQTSLTPEDDMLRDYLWPIAREIVKTAVENRQNLIIEGAYIPLDWARDFSEGYLEHIRFVCLVMSEKYLRTRFSDVLKYADVVERRLGSPAAYALHDAVRDNAQFLDQARRVGARYFLIDDAYPLDPDMMLGAG